MSLFHLLAKCVSRTCANEVPSVDFLHGEGQAVQLGGGRFMSKLERGKLKILIVDDDEESAKMLGEAMQFYGYQVEVTFSGVEALAVLDQSKIDIAMLDLGMPGMTGVELAERIRTRHTEDDLLLISLTGWGHEVAHEVSKSAGFDFRFVKPADPGSLCALIDEEEFRRRVSGERHEVKNSSLSPSGGASEKGG